MAQSIKDGRSAQDSPLLSVVIPVYNVEKYLRECLDSIVNQTYKNLEIIIVNDCSPDNSESIILEYAEKDDRIVYIKHDVNRGLWGARQSGVFAASGDYVLHVDSDDYIMPELCRKLAGLMSQEPDCIVYNIKNSKGENWYNRNLKNFYGDEFFKSFLSIDIAKGYLCQKVYKSAILKKVFQELNIQDRFTIDEDSLVNVCASYYCKKVLYLNYLGYMYDVCNESGTTRQKRDLKYCTHVFYQFKISISHMKKFFKSHNLDIKMLSFIEYRMYKYLIELSENLSYSDKKEFVAVILAEREFAVGVFMSLIYTYPKNNEHSPHKNNEYAALKDMNLTRRVKHLAKIETKRILKRLGLFELVKRLAGRH